MPKSLSKRSKLDFILRSFQATLSVTQKTIFLISGIKKVCGLLVNILSNVCMAEQTNMLEKTFARSGIFSLLRT